MDGSITVSESNGKSESFDNYKHQANVEYILKEDPVTRKFPVLSIDFDFEGGYGAEFYARVCIPKARYCFEESFEHDDEEDRWYVEIEIDANDLDVDAKTNELTVYIYTKTTSP